jgi:hypothetical protein
MEGSGKGRGVLDFGIRVIDFVQVKDQQNGMGWDTALIVVQVRARQRR